MRQMHKLLRFTKMILQSSKPKNAEKQNQDSDSMLLPAIIQNNRAAQQISAGELQRAIENGYLTIYYQPLVTHEGQIHSAEALIRLVDPAKGMISPRHFIPLAEQTGLINTLTKWVIINVCAQLKAWGESGHAICPISINLSPNVLINPNFFEFVKEQLGQQQIPAKYLQFEITEISQLSTKETISETLNNLRSLGITIALDDFGTGYSSLDYLRSFQVDSFKIDQVFIQNLDAKNTKNQTIVSTLVYLAKSLDLNIVAEGVEKYEQFQFLKQQEYPYMQGNLFSEPVPLSEFEELLQKGTLLPKCTTIKNNYQQIRKYYRFKFPHLVQAEMTVIEVNNKKVDLKTANILIEDISLGGLKIQSHLSLPVASNIRFRFIFTVMNETFDKTGKLLWKNEGKSKTYIYGVEFDKSQVDDERLAPIINQMTALRYNQREIPDTPFIYEDASMFFNKDVS